VSEFDFKIGSRDGRLAPSKSSANEDDDLCRMVEEDEMDVEIKEFVDADVSRARQHISVSAVVPPEHVRIATGLPYQTEIPNLVSEEPVAPFSVPEVDISFLPYIEYQGRDFADPRTAHPAAVTQGLLKIIEVEGPMVVKRTYDVYLRGCGIRRMGHELKSMLNRSLQSAVRQGMISVEDEMRRGGLLYSVARVKGSPPLKLRKRGIRALEEVPASELQAIARYLSDRRGFEHGSDDHLHAILGVFDLKRLTTQAGTLLLDVIDRQFSYVDEWLASSFPR
jgi:hypothetical protein